MSDQSQGSGWWQASDGRWYPPEPHPGLRRSRPWLIGLTAALVGAIVASVVGVVVDSDSATRRYPAMPTPVLSPLRRDFASPSSLPTATLTVFSDGCGVIRSEIPVVPSNLTWSISDLDGFEVLGRGAEGETRYRYSRPGTYTVVLKAFDGRAYVPISNTVTITC